SVSQRLQWNRVILYVRPPWDVGQAEMSAIVRRIAPETVGAGLEKVVAHVHPVAAGDADDDGREVVIHMANPVGRGLVVSYLPPAPHAIRPLSEYMQRAVLMRRRGFRYPYELVRTLTPEAGTETAFPPGDFTEYDLEGDRLVPVDRPPGENRSNLVVGAIRNFTEKHPEGMRRVILLGDPSRNLGALAEPECRRIIAALDLAEALEVPVEWFALSSGARIAMDSGTENMDWIAAVLRRIIEFTQHGGELNVVVTGINVGAQPYWNAEATMLMHTKGILVMTPDGAMVLTGKQALDYSGGVSAEDNFGIGGYERVMGPNGQAQYWAADIEGASRILFAHYEHAFRAPGERYPRRARTNDPYDRDVQDFPHTPPAGSDFHLVGDVFSARRNPGRKQPFDMRSVMRSVTDLDHEPLERWAHLADADTSIVWDAHVGGIPVCLLGFESHPVTRRGLVPADGPPQWTAGTLFPIASKKTARAINAASGNRPLVVLANLSGFDGSPESMRRLQLEYGAEIGRAVTNFEGPIVFCVVSRYHGGAFVVFSKPLNERVEIAAVEGSYASVIGGAPAAAVVFAREVDGRTAKDARVVAMKERLATGKDADPRVSHGELDALVRTVRAEKLGDVANEFDQIHTIERARAVGSVDRLIPPAELRPYLIDALERGMARDFGGRPPEPVGATGVPAAEV
ncbi:MAG: carboxyl transferase domain-containing protein, partial [Acidimicrobiia bacterium]